MKRYLVALFLVLLVTAAFAVNSSGVGSPYSLTPTARGDLYRDKLNGNIWVSGSDTKGDWAMVEPVIANGSPEAPFYDLNATKVTVGVASSVASAPAPLDVTVLYATSTAASNTLRIADGEEGQLYNVIYGAELAAGDTIEIIPAKFADGASITLDAKFKRAMLVFVAGKWHLLYTNGTVNQ